MLTTLMEWRPCPGFAQYEISESGDLRRLNSSQTRKAGWRHRGYINSDGYLEYALRDESGRKVHALAHRLVAEAFIGPAPSSSHEVAHKNGSRVEHHYRNLRWAERVENHADLQVHGTATKGERNGRAKVTDADVIDIRREYLAIKASAGKRSVRELDDRYGLSRTTLLRIAKGQAWRHVA